MQRYHVSYDRSDAFALVGSTDLGCDSTPRFAIDRAKIGPKTVA